MHIIISTLKTTVRIIRSRREATNTCSAWCSYCSRAHDRHWQSFITFYQWGQSQAQNPLTHSTRQPVPVRVCSWHKLGSQEVISVITAPPPETHKMLGTAEETQKLPLLFLPNTSESSCIYTVSEACHVFSPWRSDMRLRPNPANKVIYRML